MASYWVITSRAKGGANNPFGGSATSNTTSQLKQMTEQEIYREYQDSGQLQDAFGSWNNYKGYVLDSQEWIQTADWMLVNPTYEVGSKEWLFLMGEDIMWAPGERERIQEKIIQDRLLARQNAFQGWLNSEESQALMQKWGLEPVIYNNDGDQFKWTGSGYQKTIKVDDHPSFGDYAKAIITTAVTAAATFGVASSAAGATLTNFFTSAGLSNAAATAATSSIISSGVGAVLGQDVTPESLLVNALGAGLGAEVAGLAGLGGAAGSALSATVSEAVVQGIMDGELDFGDLLQAGFLGGTQAVGVDLFKAMVDGTPFTFGGLIDQNDSLYALFNGAPGSGENGWIGDMRGAFDQFVEQNITGGEWWSNATEDFDTVYFNGNGTVTAVGYDGTEQFFDSVDDFIAAGFQEMSGTSVMWDLISKSMDQIPDSWYDQLYDWMTDPSRGGSHTTDRESGTNTTITVDPSLIPDDPDDFDCSSVNRQQVAGATTGTECGPCVDGYQPDVDGICVEGVTEQCPEGQVWNDITLQCEDEVFFEEGQPCNTADGTQGLFNADGECVVSDGTGDGDGDGDGDGTDDGTDDGGEGCQDPNRLVTVNGECSDTCRSGYELDTELDECVPSTVGPPPNGCEEGAPSTEDYGGYTFDYQAAYREWVSRCGETTCIDGTPKSEDPNCDGNQPVDGEQCTTDDGQNGYYEGGVCVPITVPVEQCSDPDRQTKNDGSCAELCNDGTVPDMHEEGLCGNPLTAEPPEECDNGATVESGCSECADGTFPEDYEDGKCPSDVTTTPGGGDGDGDGDTDCTLVECDAPRPEGEAGVAWDECCTDVTTTPTDGGETDCTLVECDSPRPDAQTSPDAAALWDDCCKDVTTTPPGGGGNGGGSTSGGRSGGFGGGRGMFQPYTATISADPQLLSRSEFPITDFLAGIFTNSRGGRNV